MKQIITTLFLIFSLSVFAQTNQFTGEYERKFGPTEEEHIIEYKLTLNQDGTFLFHSYSNFGGVNPTEVNKYGKGKWTSKDNMITFSSAKEDFDKKYTLDFNTSVARFITKNPRDKSDQAVKTRLTILESKISWLQRLDIFKI